ncbi:hypothetical protein QMK33_13190 [Hymenobacter sp. H14-R3]|uniref:hypothetical protein n=1 Tax=Hymenobacter sp. H14-R3 TaxID=3046308 RepID=UPI0024BA3E9F|nr:hypothetical protein [Hymenobacter sp. H14-R3]MDJ0366112.1 hypothetical protein [Hymenobacter sp. H14-R3]
MNADNPVMLRVVLGFLRAGRVLDGASSVLLLGTLVQALIPASATVKLCVVVALLLAALAKYLAWRVALDVEFFALLHEQPTQAADFDAALAAFLGRKVGPPARSLAGRWQGARRLVIYQAVVLGAQALIVSWLLLFSG